ncbi:MAG: YCF48-related protein, partial [Thermoleophilia bacterium]
MKKRLLTLQISLALALLALFVFVPLALAGLSTGSGAWEWVNPAVQGNNVNAISFVNGTTGWAAGSAGLVMKTTDGGTNWTSQIPSAFATPAYSCHGAAIGSGCGLRGVFFLDASTGWVVGDSGTIWKTTDGGTIWTDQHPNLPVLGGGYDASPPALRSVHFFNASNGIIVGDNFTFYTSNGGTTWTQGSGTSTISLTSVQMLSASTAVAVGGSGAIYKTINSGATWTARTSTPTTTSNLSSVSFSTATNGFAVGGDPTGRLLRTTDGGETWQSNTTVIPTILTGVAIVAIPGGDILVTTGYSGNIRKYTVDIWNGAIDTVAAGLATVTSGTGNTLITASVAPGTANVFVGGVAGIVLASGDSGTSWSLKAGGTAISYYSSSFVDADYGWMVGKSGTVNRTINGGAAWSSDNSGIAGTADLYGVDFRNSSLGYAVGSIPGTPNTGVAYRYNTGTWSAMTLPAGVSYLSEVRMSDDTHGWAVGEEGVILHTTDGANWTKDVPSTTYSLNSVDTTSNTDGWAVGSAPCPSGCSGGQTLKGVILKYNGSDWMTIPVTEKFNVNYFT